MSLTFNFEAVHYENKISMDNDYPTSNLFIK